MQVVKVFKGSLQFESRTGLIPEKTRQGVVTGLAAIDDLLPGGEFATGAIHEVLGVTEYPPLMFPLLIAKNAVRGGVVAWTDPRSKLHPPGLAMLGLPLSRLLILRPQPERDALWAVSECLRCKLITVCVAMPNRLSRTDARKLQLAAERGGGIGLLLRPFSALSSPYAAATRWIVRPIAGQRMMQRWSVELIHGHGGRVGHSVIVEACRETLHVRATEAMADRQDHPKVVAASA